MATQTIDLNNVTSVIVEDTTSQIVYPNISEIYLNSEKIWPTAPAIEYFTIEGSSAFDISIRYQCIDNSIEYSLDNGVTWTEAYVDKKTFINVSSSKILLRGTGNSGFYNISNVYSLLSLPSANINLPNLTVSGDLETLLDYQTVLNGQHPTMVANSFTSFFEISKVVDAENLKLPTILSEGCFSKMFYGCAYLTKVPALPATTLTRACYQNMFNGCSRLVSVPSNYLPAQDTTYNCYNGMFRDCTALTTPPSLPSTSNVTTNGYCYQDMFNGCTNLEKIPLINLQEFRNYKFKRMFQGCSKIKISSTQTGEYINEYRLPATGTAVVSGTNWNTDMFKNTGGTFTSNPSANTTYYTSNQVI